MRGSDGNKSLRMKALFPLISEPDPVRCRSVLNGVAVILRSVEVAKAAATKKAAKKVMTKKEKSKRLSHTTSIIRRLFAHSGNLCAFPGCAALMINANGDPIGQICHIEGVGGERHNPDMSDVQMAAFENLMLMCYEHHVVTNDEEKYTVEVLRNMKANHEKYFSHPERVIIEALSDSTEKDVVNLPQNLHRLAKVLKWKLTDEQLSSNFDILKGYIKLFRLVPQPTRMFVGEVAKRIHKMRSSGHVKDDGHIVGITFTDLVNSIHLNGKAVGFQYLYDRAGDLEKYRVGGYQDHMGDDGEHMLTLSQPEDWSLWDDLIKFTSKEKVPLNDFIADLDFSSLGE